MEGVDADIMTFAKGIGSGFPMAGVATRKDTFDGIAAGQLVSVDCLTLWGSITSPRVMHAAFEQTLRNVGFFFSCCGCCIFFRSFHDKK